jgi:hypothetical protein
MMSVGYGLADTLTGRIACLSRACSHGYCRPPDNDILRVAMMRCIDAAGDSEATYAQHSTSTSLQSESDRMGRQGQFSLDMPRYFTRLRAEECLCPELPCIYCTVCTCTCMQTYVDQNEYWQACSRACSLQWCRPCNLAILAVLQAACRPCNLARLT